MRRLLALLTATLLGVGLLAGPAPAPAAAASGVSAENVQQLRDTFDGINDYRRSKGLPVLRLSPEIAVVAQDWSDRMAETHGFYHNPDYAKQYPAGWASAGEIIAHRSDRVARGLVNQWINSPGHEALMTGNFNVMGVGIAFGGQRMYGTTNLSRYPNVDDVVTYRDVDEWLDSNGADLRDGARVGLASMGGGRPGVVQVNGWAFDFSARDAPSNVRIELEGSDPVTVMADAPTPAHQGLERFGVTGNHGFSVTIAHSATAYRQARLCVIGLNTYGDGADSAPVCSDVGLFSVPPPPTLPPAPAIHDAAGEITTVRDVGDGTVEVQGWAVDQTDLTQPSSARLWPRGSSVSQVVIADRPTPEAPGFAGRHGFTALVPHGLTETNVIQMCGEALNTIGAGSSRPFSTCVNVLVTVTPPSTPPPSPDPSFAVTRVEGADRYETATRMSQLLNLPADVDTAYLVSGQKFPDALSAAPAAAQPGSALLLTPADGLADSVARELQRLDPTHVILIGGPTTLSPTVDADVRRSLPGSSVTRIAGADRWETSVLIAEHAFPDAVEAFVTSGEVFPDALSAAPVAAAGGAPVLLTSGGNAPTRLQDYLRAAELDAITVVGGTPSVSSAAFASIRASSGADVRRLAGADRFETNLLLAQELTTSRQAAVMLASGVNFPDALAGAAIAPRVGPMLLSRPECIPASTLSVLDRAYRPANLMLLGGPTTLSPEVAALRSCR